MSGSVSAVSYRIGSSMTWGYSSSPIFLSSKVKNNILLSKLLPSVLRRFGLHVVEFYSFFGSSFLLFILVSKLLFLQQKIRRRYARRRSRKKKVFHRITYSLNKNFVNWRVLSFVRNSFRSYRKVSRVLSFHFYNKFIKAKFKYRRFIRSIAIAKKVLRFLRFWYLIKGKHFFRFFTNKKKNLKVYKLKKKNLFRITRFKRSSLPLRYNYKFLVYLIGGLKFFLSPILLSKLLLTRRSFFYKQYFKLKKAFVRFKSKRFLRKNFTTVSAKPRKRFLGGRKRYLHKSLHRFRRSAKRLRTRSVVFYSFKRVHTRAKLLYRLFKIIFIQRLLIRKQFFNPIHFKKAFTTLGFKFRRKLLLRSSKYTTAFSRLSKLRGVLRIHRIFLNSTLKRRKKNAARFSHSILPFNFTYLKSLLPHTYSKLVTRYYVGNTGFMPSRLYSLMSKKRKNIYFFTHRIFRKHILLRKNQRVLYNKNRLVFKKKKLSLPYKRLNYTGIKLKTFFFKRIFAQRFNVFSNYFLYQKYVKFLWLLTRLKYFYKNKRLRRRIYTFIKMYRSRRWGAVLSHTKFILLSRARNFKKSYLFRARYNKLFLFNHFLQNRLKLTRGKRKRVFHNKYKARCKYIYHRCGKTLLRVKKKVIKNLYFFSKYKNKLLGLFHRGSLFFGSNSFIAETRFLYRLKIKLFSKKKWIFKKNFEFFISMFIGALIGLSTNVFLLDGLYLLSRSTHIDRILGIKLVFKRAFISKKNYFFFKNFVNLFFQSIYFKTIWSLTRYFSKVYYYRKTQKYTTQTITRVFRTLNVLTVRFVGVNILISGKIGRRRRAKSICFTKNKLPNLSSLSLKVQYCYTQCITNFGVYGIRFWLYSY